jgi:hypothetical protein
MIWMPITRVRMQRSVLRAAAHGGELRAELRPCAPTCRPRGSAALGSARTVEPVITTLAIENYRSLRRLIVPLATLNVVTGANGSGKSSLYRALRLLADS